MRIKDIQAEVIGVGKLTPAQRRAAIQLGQQLVPNTVPEMLYLAAVKGKQIVGVLSADCACSPAVVHVLAVDPKHQRQGIGMHLIEDFEKRMQFLDISDVEVDCNTAESQALFEKAGYAFNGKYGYKHTMAADLSNDLH